MFTSSSLTIIILLNVSIILISIAYAILVSNHNKLTVSTVMYIAGTVFATVAVIVLIINFKTSNSDQTATIQSPTPISTPNVSHMINLSPTPQKCYWLDEFSPIISQPENFSLKHWDDGASFCVEGKLYQHGIGMLINGSSAEELSIDPNLKYRNDCREAYIEYPLHSKYSSFTFSIGAENGDPTCFGDQATNGVARTKISSGSGDLLFDTSWVDYRYSNYEITLDISSVDILRITYCVSGTEASNKLKNPLRFAIVDPILILKSDVE